MCKLIVTFFLSAFFILSNAQSVEDYFHSASNLYINGNMKEAKSKIQEGMVKFPNDPKLRALAEKIKDDENKDQNKKDQQQNNQDKKNEDQKKQEQQKQQEQKDKQEQQKGGQQQQISKQDAERLLEAMEQDEKNVMKKVQDQKAQIRKIPVEKEW